MSRETLRSLARNEVKKAGGGAWTCFISCRADCGTETLSIDLCDPGPSN